MPKRVHIPTADERAARFSDPSRFVTDADLADRYGVHRATTWRWSREGKFPQPVTIGPGTTRWRVADVLDHEARVGNTAA